MYCLMEMSTLLYTITLFLQFNFIPQKSKLRHPAAFISCTTFRPHHTHKKKTQQHKFLLFGTNLNLAFKFCIFQQKAYIKVCAFVLLSAL